MKLPYALLAAAILALLPGCGSPGSTDVSGSGGSAEIKIVEVQGHRFAVIVGYEKCAICEVTGASRIQVETP